MNRQQIKQTQSNCLDRQSLYTQIQEQTNVRTRWTDAFIDIQQKVRLCMLTSPVSRNNFDNTIAMSQANSPTPFLKSKNGDRDGVVKLSTLIPNIGGGSQSHCNLTLKGKRMISQDIICVYNKRSIKSWSWRTEVF